MSPKEEIHKKENATGFPFYRLRLFVAGDEPNSAKARAVLSRLCDERLGDRAEIQVVDIYEDYQAAIDNDVIAVPALVIESPPPVRTIVGSLSDEDKVLAMLGLTEKEGGHGR